MASFGYGYNQQQQQQPPSYGYGQQQQQQPPSYGYGQQPAPGAGPPPPISAGASIPVLTSTVTENHPYATKSMLLYVIQNHPACNDILNLLKHHDEVLVIDALQVNPRPYWLVGTPTLVTLRPADKAIDEVKQGPDAYRLAAAYVQAIQQRGGAQSTRVIGGGAYQTGGYQMQPTTEAGYNAPIGIATLSTTYAGTVDFGSLSDPRYSSSSKVSEAEIAAYTKRREQQPQAPASQQQWKPSVLANGDMVNL